MENILEKLKALVESGQLTEEEFELLSKSVSSNEDEEKQEEPGEPEPVEDSSEESKETPEENPDPLPDAETSQEENQESVQTPPGPVEEMPPEPPVEPDLATPQPNIMAEIQSQLDAFGERIAAMEDIVSSLSRHEDKDDSKEDFGVGAGDTGNGSNPNAGIMAEIIKKLGY